MIRLLLLSLVLLLNLSTTVNAQEKTDLLAWGSLPILHEGRIKPLDSFARIYLKTFSGREHVEGLNATEWLAESVFTPAVAINRPIFKIRDAQKYGLTETKNRLYSYTDLASIIDNRKNIIQQLTKVPEENWNQDQVTLMTLYQNFILQTQILRSLTSILPFDSDSKENSKNFLNYKNLKTDLDQRTQKIVKKKGSDPETYSAAEKEVVLLSYQLNLLEKGGKNNVLFRIIPLHWEDKNTEWLSPWEINKFEPIPPKGLEYIEKWQNMAQAYRAQDIQNQHAAMKNIDLPASETKLYVEKTYNLLHLLGTALVLYSLSFFFLILSNLNQKYKFKKLAFIALTTGFIAHLIHIILRIYILNRPPVGTLYESILFVSLICILGFIYMVHKQKSSTGTLLGALSGIMLLVTAQGFAGEDTMNTLVAVLNTNFWLTTHVLCITIGYSWCFIASLMAHYALITKYLGRDNWSALLKNIKTLAILSLLFTTIGTILGGIWADQSWGRFWGWDPKENGALLIVLWLAWLLHGRVSKHINEVGFVVGTAFLSIIVVIAWFGVNLLSIGLHSYGFISGVAVSITLFCILETLIIGGLWIALWRKSLA